MGLFGILAIAGFGFIVIPKFLTRSRSTDELSGTADTERIEPKKPKGRQSKDTDAQRDQERLEELKHQIVKHLNERQSNPVLSVYMKRRIREAIAAGREIDAMVVCGLTPANAMSGVEGVLANSDLDLSGFSPEDTSELVRTYIGVHLDAVRDFVATEHQVRRIFSAESAKSEAALRYANPETVKNTQESTWDKEFHSVGVALESLDKQRAAKPVSRASKSKRIEKSIAAASRKVKPVDEVAESPHSHYIRNRKDRAKKAENGIF